MKPTGRQAHPGRGVPVVTSPPHARTRPHRTDPRCLQPARARLDHRPWLNPIHPISLPGTGRFFRFLSVAATGAWSAWRIWKPCGMPWARMTTPFWRTNACPIGWNCGRRAWNWPIGCTRSRSASRGGCVWIWDAAWGSRPWWARIWAVVWWPWITNGPPRASPATTPPAISASSVPQPCFVQMDWRFPAVRQGAFDRLWAGDVMYEKRFIEPVAAFLDHALAVDGVAWVAEPDRDRV